MPIDREGIAQSTAAIAREVATGRLRAHDKHGSKSVEGVAPLSDRFLTILTEEVGEAATVLNEHALGNVGYDLTTADLRAELLDVATVAVAWIAAIDRAVTI